MANRYSGRLLCFGLLKICIICLCSDYVKVTTGLSATRHGITKNNLRQTTTTTRLELSKWRRSYFDEEGDKERQVERPTQTRMERYKAPVSSPKPKIVVLGATGRIGRLVVQQLMEMSLDCTVVAVVRDYNEASRTFYTDGEGTALVPRNNKRGPQLEIVEGDLVPSEALPGYVDLDFPEEELDWKQRAESVSDFYVTRMEDYDNRADNPMPTSIHETLEKAVQDCTAIISCVGSVRPTNVWTDLLKVPLWRLLRKDVSGWCRDKRHPFYVHYAATRMVLGIAESEQRRRQAAAQVQAEVDAENNRFDNNTTVPQVRVPRIRFVRVSDLCVAHKALDFVPLVTNTLQSMVFRYQNMAERIMDESSVVDTITLRPGDLMDDDRDVDTTSLQVDPSGRVPCPARVGRADVAALSVAAALFTSNEEIAAAKQKNQPNTSEKSTTKEDHDPFHYTLGVRWAGQDLHPYPPQGFKHDGLEDAHLCMNRVLKIEKQKAKRQRRLQQLRREASLPARIVHGLQETRRRKQLKPYGVCCAVLSYLLLGFLFTALSRLILLSIPGRHHVVAAVTRFRDSVWATVLKRLPIKPQTATPPTPPKPKRLRLRNHHLALICTDDNITASTSLLPVKMSDSPFDEQHEDSSLSNAVAEESVSSDAANEPTSVVSSIASSSDNKKKNSVTNQKEEDTVSTSSFGDVESDVPLFKYARLVGSLPRLPRRVSQDGTATVIGSNSNHLSDPCTCSAMGRVGLPPAAAASLDGMDGSANKSTASSNDPSVAQPPQYHILAMGFESGKLCLTDATTGIAVVPSDQLHAHATLSKRTPFVDVSFDASGTFLAAVNTNGLVAVWEFRFVTAVADESVVGVPNSSFAVLKSASVQMSRISYPSSFGTPTCLRLDPAYKKRREKAVLVGFDDGRLVMTKRGFMMFGRRSDSVIYQSPDKQNGGIQALAWRGSLVAWADTTGVKLFDVETMARIAHIDRPSGARLSLYPTLSSLRPSLLFETSESFLIAWGDCVMAMAIKEKAVTTDEEGGASVGSTASGDGAVMQQSLRHVECTMAWELDCVSCGVVPLDSEHLVVLGLWAPEEEASGSLHEDDNDKPEAGRVSLISSTASLPSKGNDLEVHVISRSQGTVVHCDALPLLEPARNGAGPAESASAYMLMSSYALPRMDDAIEIEEEGLLGEDEDFDFEMSLFQSSSSDIQKREFKDPHVKWSLRDLSFHHEGADKEAEAKDETRVNLDDDDIQDDARSVASDDYEFMFRSLEATPTEPTGSLEFPPIMVVASRSDVVLAQTRDIDDAISHAIADGKHAVALRLALCHKRDLRRYDIHDLIDGYLVALLRLPAEESDIPKPLESSKDLSVYRMRVATNALPVLLGGNIKLWEKWVSVFAEIPGALFVLKNRLPVRDPKLPPHVYQKVLAKMLLEVEGMVSEDRDDAVYLYQQAKDHFLNALCAWGPTSSLRDHIKCYTYDGRSGNAIANPRLDEAESSLLRRLHQSAVGFLEFPASTSTPSTAQPLIEGVSAFADSSDSLFSIEALLSRFSSHAPLIANDAETDEEVSNLETANSHVALEAMAELNWMRDRFETSLQCFLTIGCLHAVPDLSTLEDQAAGAVNDVKDRNKGKDKRNPSCQYAHVVALIESHHLHGCLLDENFLPTPRGDDRDEDDNYEHRVELLPPVVSLVRLVGLVRAGEFLVEHCFHAVRATSYRPGGSRSLEESTSPSNNDWITTFPVNVVARQLSGHPKLLYWFLHLIFEQKPEVYVKFPNTAVPPPEIRELHRSHLDLYIQFAGEARDSARFLSRTKFLSADKPTTPLLGFLKSVLPLGSLRADDVKRLLDAQRIGKGDPSLVDATGDVRFPHFFALELAYIMEHYGKVNKEKEANAILELYLKGAKSLSLAAFYAQRNTEHSSLLWGRLLDHCLNREDSSDGIKSEFGKVDGTLFGSLLEAAALSGADLAHLVTEIPQGMRIEGLRPRLVAAVTDYRLKLQMHQAASKVLSEEKVVLLRELGHRSRRGTRYQVREGLSSYRRSRISPEPDTITHEQEEQTRGGIETGTVKKSHPVSSPLSNLRPSERRSRRRLSFSLPIR